jgi:hypothetical protein
MLPAVPTRTGTALKVVCVDLGAVDHDVNVHIGRCLVRILPKAVHPTAIMDLVAPNCLDHDLNFMIAGMWPTTVAGMWPTTVAGGHLIARPGLRDVNVHMRTRRESFG